MENNKAPENQSDEKKKVGMNQALVIAVIGALATVLATSIPALINALNKQPSAPTLPISSDTVVISAESALVTVMPSPSAFVTITETLAAPIGIYDAFLSLDKAGQFPSKTFSPRQTVYVVFSLNDPSGMNFVRIIWYAANVDGFPANHEIRREESTILASPYVFEMFYNKPQWKVGTYKAELYLNGSLCETLEFEIK
jgi:hypothetical protein